MNVYRLAIFTLVVSLIGCADAQLPDNSVSDRAWLDEYGLEGPFDDAIDDGKEDTISGPRESWERSDEVWPITNQWTDVTAEAGLAWGENSGLDFEQKYRAWVGGLNTIPRTGGGTSFEITTPQGVTLPAPILECAEVAIFLRATFASWHGLPFYMRASKSGQPIYLGHFGFRNHDGTRYGRTPHFRSRYDNLTAQWDGQGEFPSDPGLRVRGLYGGGDEVPFLPEVDGEPARAGAYFDAIYLNKRTGHFMLMVLSYFGSINLASNVNMMHVTAEATEPGDVLLHRWARRGIGHTIPVFHVERSPSGLLDFAVATGSMPRRQPKWESGPAVHRYFTSSYAGGPGENNDEDRYASLGGGIRRWRTPVVRGGVYRAGPRPGEEELIVPTSDLDAVAARVNRFDELFEPLDPAVERQVLLDLIQDQRDHLSNYPASCAARRRREGAFRELYSLSDEHFSQSVAAVDSTYRSLEDYVFAELVYDESRTCCWNSSTHNMFEIVMLRARAEQTAAEEAQICVSPTAFMGRAHQGNDDGYSQYRLYAEELGRGDEWVAWSADESCPQADVVDDRELTHDWTPFCDLTSVTDEATDPIDDQDPVDDQDPDNQDPVDDSGEDDLPGCGDTGDSADTAATLPSDQSNLRICPGEEDWWVVTAGQSGEMTVTIQFAHDDGDLDLEVLGSGDPVIAQSVTDDEVVTLAVEQGQLVTIHVYGYDGATGAYALAVTN